MENKIKVEVAIKSLAKDKQKIEFYPEWLANHLQINAKEVFGYLLEMVMDKKLEIIYFVQCEHCIDLSPYSEIKITGESDKRVYQCVHCNKYSKATLDQVIPKFCVTDEYREHVKNSKIRLRR